MTPAQVSRRLLKLADRAVALIDQRERYLRTRQISEAAADSYQAAELFKLGDHILDLGKAIQGSARPHRHGGKA
jgi:hypothetical protein